jgi:hypothetical protein
VGHDFAFLGGDVLSKIGATWFVSFAFYETVDPSHRKWAGVKTAAMRQSTFRQSRENHRVWLEQVAGMNPSLLNRNTIGIPAHDCKAMALAVLRMMPS